jgi:Zn-dependent protease with chaperone function
MMPIQMAFISWNRRSEFSADRAALLALQDVAPCVSMLTKLAGGTSRFASELDPAVFLEQAKEFSEDMDKSNTSKVYRLLASMNKGTHPFTVERARALNEWVDSRQFEDMLAGNYERVMTGPGSRCVK